MKNYDFQEKHLQISDPIESYFECISSFKIANLARISRYLEKLKKHDN